MRSICRTDLYFLLRYILKRPDVDHPWIFDRCREVQENPNGYLDLWSREHYKSSIITFGKSIQDILSSHGDEPLPEWNGQEITIGIFSHTRPLAKNFLRQIKREFETNRILIDLFPDVLWENPDKESPKWSEDDGLIVVRKSNPKESTVEAWGFEEGAPVGKHFLLRVYDDILTADSVTNPEKMQKTLRNWELSLNLGTRGGIERHAGTRYHQNDCYGAIIKRGAVIPRIYKATIDGTMEGEPVLLSRLELAEKRRKMGPYTFACQIMMDPQADSIQGFKRNWFKTYQGRHDGQGMNIYMLVDPANEKKKNSDYTAIFVIGIGPDGNTYILDMVRDRLNLTERTEKLFQLQRKWIKSGQKIPVGYEKYGKDADIEHIRSRMKTENFYFYVIPLGGSMKKEDRIRRLIPDFENGNIMFPESLSYINYEKVMVDLVEVFVEEEYVEFPVAAHDDMLDALARMKDEDFPITQPSPRASQVIHIPGRKWLNATSKN